MHGSGRMSAISLHLLNNAYIVPVPVPVPVPAKKHASIEHKRISMFMMLR